MIVFDWDGDEDIVDIDNARIPQAVRTHGARFRNPARFVADLGNDEYVLFAEDGELLDLVYLRCGTPQGCPLGAVRRKRSGSFREAIADNTLHGPSRKHGHGASTCPGPHGETATEWWSRCDSTRIPYLLTETIVIATTAPKAILTTGSRLMKSRSRRTRARRVFVLILKTFSVVSPSVWYIYFDLVGFKEFFYNVFAKPLWRQRPQLH